MQLVYQDWRTEWFPLMAQQMLEQFNATHPNIRVFYTLDPEDLEGKMLASMQAGTAPDVFQGCCTHFPTWAQRGYTLDLRPYVKADLDQATIEDWDPAQYRALFTPDGRQFGLPKYHGALALYYNRDLFNRYGVDYPSAEWDHEDYARAMRLLTRDRTGGGQTDVWGSIVDVSWERLQVHVNAWGGHFVDPEDPTRCAMADPQSIEALEWLRARMWGDRILASPHDVQKMSTSQAFVAQRVAMVEDGSWALKDVLTGADFRVGLAPFPAGPVRRASLATTDGFGIYSESRYRDAAWDLMKFLVSPDYGRAMAKSHFLQPARASLVNDWVGYARAEFPEKTEGLDIAAFAESQVRGYSVTAEIFSENMAEAKRVADAAWEQIFVLGKGAVDRTMRQASEQISRLMEAQSAEPTKTN